MSTIISKAGGSAEFTASGYAGGRNTLRVRLYQKLAMVVSSLMQWTKSQYSVSTIISKVRAYDLAGFTAEADVAILREYDYIKRRRQNGGEALPGISRNTLRVRLYQKTR